MYVVYVAQRNPAHGEYIDMYASHSKYRDRKT